MSALTIDHKEQVRSLYHLALDIMIGADEALKDAVLNEVPAEEIQSRREEYSRSVERFKHFEAMMISLEGKNA